MQSHQLKFPKTAHYYSLGYPGPSIQKVFLVMHGYGQLASRFIYKFDQLPDNCLILAPEGSSRFYWNEKKGIVGASWMTKADRLIEIEDYSNYIQHLYDFYISQLSETVQINILGFSQGGATAIRWLQNKKPKFHNLILWGAGFPEDIDYTSDAMQDYLKDKNMYMLQGAQDPYISAEKRSAHQQFTAQQGLQYELILFEGQHEIDRKVLSDLVERL